MTRIDVLQRVCFLAGQAVTVINPSDGWPGLVHVTLESGAVQPVALHASVVSSHNRAEHELRFQNPGNSKPVGQFPNAVSILVGLWEEAGQPPLLVAVDGLSRVGRSTRFSILFDRRVLGAARSSGWAIYESTTGEKIYAFRPTLLPIFVTLVASGLAVDFPAAADDAIANAAVASGLADDENEATARRTRRAADVLVRHYAFSRNVLNAYSARCAMCGLNSGLVVGAHIHPVAAAGAPDAIWNGLALCHNHHAAFDAHKIWVHPYTYEIQMNPELGNGHAAGPALAAFIGTTQLGLSVPLNPHHRPRQEMFEARYSFFDGRYNWVR